jgi:hypothetical protein
VAPNTTNRRSAIDGRTTRHRGHTISQRIRKHPMCGNPAGSGSGNHSVRQVLEHELGGSR